MSQSDTSVRELNPGIFQIRGLNGSSHGYVIKGLYMNVMIDSGSEQNFTVLERGLFPIGLKVRDINLVINSMNIAIISAPTVISRIGDHRCLSISGIENGIPATTL